MNITLLGHNDIASLYALDRVIRLLPEHRHSVLLSDEPQVKSAAVQPLAELATVDAALCKRFLCGRICGPVAKQLTESATTAFNKPNSLQGRRQLSELHPDLIISIRYRRILREEVIAIPGQGILNLHSGILPHYRGVMATFWAMLQGEQEIGTTLHRIVDSGIDTGPVIEIRRRATRPERSYLANVLGLYAEGSNAIAAAVRLVAAGRELSDRDQLEKGQYFATPDASDVQRFENTGLRLVDGGEEAEIGADA